jgi:hypothetical protein
MTNTNPLANIEKFSGKAATELTRDDLLRFIADRTAKTTEAELTVAQARTELDRREESE